MTAYGIWFTRRYAFRGFTIKNILLALILFPTSAFACCGLTPDIDLGGILFALLTVPVSILAILAYVVRNRGGKDNYRSKVFISLVFGYVLCGILFVSKPYFWGALNPWFYKGSSFVAFTCLIFSYVSICYFYNTIRAKLVLAVIFLLVIIIEAFTTPGARIYYPNNPLSENSIKIIRYDKHYIGLPDGKILYVENEMFGGRPKESIEANLIPVESSEEETYLVKISHTISWNQKRKGKDKLVNKYIRNPFRGSYGTRDYGIGVILPESWKASEVMLGSAVGGFNYRINWIEELLKRGARPNYTEGGASPSLYIAIYNRDLNVLRLLLEYGANINIAKADGDTPLHLAVQLDVSHEKAFQAIKFLLENGADLDIANNQGETPRNLFMTNFEKAHTSWHGYPTMVKVKNLMDVY